MCVCVYSGKVTELRALTESELYDKLRTLRTITGNVYIQSDGNLFRPSTFKFLANLEVIEGRVKHGFVGEVNSAVAWIHSRGHNALTITNNPSLHYLGLRSLRTVKDGNIVIKDNPQLCLVNSVNWSRIVIKRNSTDIQADATSCSCVTHTMCTVNNTLLYRHTKL